MGVGLAGCGSDSKGDNGSEGTDPDVDNTNATDLGFEAIAVSTANNVVVPAGYSAKPFALGNTDYRLLSSIQGRRFQLGADQEQQVGMHHDGMHFSRLISKLAAIALTKGCW